MLKRTNYLKLAIAKYSKKLDTKGYVANHDGNITVKTEDGLLATPTSEAKAEITPEMVIKLDYEGKKLEGIGKPFSEVKLHIAAYQARPDAQAVVHAHAPYATARGLVGQELRPRLPEAIVSIGDRIPVVPHAMPGSEENIRSVKEIFKTTDVCLIQGNGVLAIGDDLEQAFLRLELVEHLCKMECLANQMGAPMELPQNEIAQLLEKRKAAGLGPDARDLEKYIQDMPTKKPCDVAQGKPSADDIRNIIAEEISKALISN
ncbi:class II aldolase/adducin family protein [bacterium]|nr:class II aldolase/adducin family protein [bacterium]MBU1918941.1 class II aldolase/adducin family protein [bacterium]